MKVASEAEFRARQETAVNELLSFQTGPLVPGPVVDLGCGNGIAAAPLTQACPGHRLIGIDRDQRALSQARSTGLYHELHALDLVSWEPEEPVSLLFARAVFHQIGAYQALLPWFARCLAPGGQLLFQIPRSETLAIPALARSLARQMFPAIDFAGPADDGGRMEDLWQILAPFGEVRLEARERLVPLAPSEEGHPVRLMLESNLLRSCFAPLDFEQGQAFARQLDQQLQHVVPVHPQTGSVLRIRCLFAQLRRTG